MLRTHGANEGGAGAIASASMLAPSLPSRSRPRPSPPPAGAASAADLAPSQPANPSPAQSPPSSSLVGAGEAPRSSPRPLSPLACSNAGDRPALTGHGRRGLWRLLSTIQQQPPHRVAGRIEFSGQAQKLFCKLQRQARSAAPTHSARRSRIEDERLTQNRDRDVVVDGLGHGCIHAALRTRGGRDAVPVFGPSA